jgi:hypothetical protein
VSVEMQTTPTSRGKGRGRPRRPPVAADITPARRRRSRGLEALWIIALLGLLGVVLPIVISAHYGAMGIPRSDDWSYLLTLFRWVDTGKLSFNGWVSMTLVGQIAMATPIVAIAGRSITTIQVFTAMVGLVGLLGVVFIGRQAVRPAWWAVFVAVTIAAGPLWGPLAPTFMTDVPTFTFEMLTLAAAAMAFRRRPLSLPWFATSVVIGFVGVSIRQYAVIPVIAVALVACFVLIASGDRRRLRIVLIITGVFCIAALGIVYWWSGLPDSKGLTPTLPGAHSLSLMFTKDAGFLRLTGLLILPMVILAGPVRIVRRAWRASENLTTIFALGAALWLAAAYVHLPSVPFVGNYLARDGVLSIMVLGGHRPDVIPSGLYDFLALLGSLAGVLLIVATVPFFADLPRRRRERSLLTIESPLIAVMGFCVAGFCAAYTFATATGLPVYDRYALPVLPLVAFLVLHTTATEPATDPAKAAGRSHTSRVAWAGVALALLAVVGLCYTVDSASFDGTRWKVAEMATKQGYEPLQVDGGFEWLGFHVEHAFRFKRFHSVQQKLPFARPCVTILINPHKLKGTVIASAKSTAISRRPARIVAQRLPRPCRNENGKIMLEVGATPDKPAGG